MFAYLIMVCLLVGFAISSKVPPQSCPLGGINSTSQPFMSAMKGANIYIFDIYIFTRTIAPQMKTKQGEVPLRFYLGKKYPKYLRSVSSFQWVLKA